MIIKINLRVQLEAGNFSNICVGISFSYSFRFIHQLLYSPLLGPGLFFSSVIFSTQTVGLLGRVINPSQGRYLHTGQHKHRINAHTDVHALSGIRTHDPSVRASEDSQNIVCTIKLDNTRLLPLCCMKR
jgi:hypothetical protein